MPSPSDLDLNLLMSQVRLTIDSYRYEVPKESVGGAWSAVKLAQQLNEMRAALVAPYWAEVQLRDTFQQVAAAGDEGLLCAVIADDGKGMVLAFDPLAAEFLLAQQDGEIYTSFGVWGDAVGCFLAR